MSACVTIILLPFQDRILNTTSNWRAFPARSATDYIYTYTYIYV